MLSAGYRPFFFCLLIFAALLGNQFSITLRAEIMSPREVTVLRTNREGRRHCNVGQSEICECAAHKFTAGLRTRHRLIHIKVENCTARIFTLQIVLTFQRLKRIVREVHGKLRTVGVIRIRGRPCLKDLREALLVFLGKTVRRAFGWRCLQVVHMIRFFLKLTSLART